MVDRFDTLSHKLIERLEERRLSSGPGCLSVGQLEEYLVGKLTSEERGAVEAHLNGCLACVSAKVELEDFLEGIASPAPLEPALRKRLWADMKPSVASRPFLPAPRRLWMAIQEALEWRVFVGWGLSGALAGMVLAVTVANVIQEQAQVVPPPAITLRGIPQAGSEPRGADQDVFFDSPDRRGAPQGGSEPPSVPEDRSWDIGAPPWIALAAWGLAGASAGMALKVVINMARRRSTRSSAS